MEIKEKKPRKLIGLRTILTCQMLFLSLCVRFRVFKHVLGKRGRYENRSSRVGFPVHSSKSGDPQLGRLLSRRTTSPVKGIQYQSAALLDSEGSAGPPTRPYRLFLLYLEYRLRPAAVRGLKKSAALRPHSSGRSGGILYRQTSDGRAS